MFPVFPRNPGALPQGTEAGWPCLVLNALWHYYCPTINNVYAGQYLIQWPWFLSVPGIVSPRSELGIECLWHYHIVLLPGRLGIECPLALPPSPVAARYTTVSPLLYCWDEAVLETCGKVGFVKKQPSWITTMYPLHVGGNLMQQASGSATQSSTTSAPIAAEPTFIPVAGQEPESSRKRQRYWKRIARTQKRRQNWTQSHIISQHPGRWRK